MEAVKASLNTKQQLFVAAYLVDLNTTQAAIRAGYSAKTAAAAGWRLFRNVKISEAIQAGQAKKLETLDFDAQRVLQELGRLALVDLRGFFDENGNLKAIKDLTAVQGACLASFEVVKKNIAAGDGEVDTIHKIKVWDKTKALDTLAKHFGLLIDRVQISGDEAMMQALMAGRQRAAAARALLPPKRDGGSR